MIHKIYCSNYNSSSEFLYTFQASKESIAELRGGADIATLITTNLPNAGGIAFTDSWR